MRSRWRRLFLGGAALRLWHTAPCPSGLAAGHHEEQPLHRARKVIQLQAHHLEVVLQHRHALLLRRLVVVVLLLLRLRGSAISSATGSPAATARHRAQPFRDHPRRACLRRPR